LIIPGYLLVWILASEAKTAEQKLQMRGKPITVENIGKAVASEMEKNKEKNQDKTASVGSFIKFFGSFFKICLAGLGCLIGAPILFALALVVIVLVAMLFYGADLILSASYSMLATVTFTLLLLIPLAAIIYGIIACFTKPKPLTPRIKWLIFGVWILALILFFSSGLSINWKFARNIHLFGWQIKERHIIEGNGIPGERKYVFPPIDYVTVKNNLITHVQIEQVSGDSVSLLIQGDENLIDHINHRVNNGKLHLSTRKNCRFNTNNDLTVRLQTPSLKGIKMEQCGDVSILKQFVADRLKVEVDGAGTFWADSLAIRTLQVNLSGIGTANVSGYAHQATLNMDGAGKINAGELSSDTVYARMEGVGSIQCNPKEYLKGNLSGVGNINYKNEPKEKVIKIFGIGKITKK
jgi:hypothetical protein